MELTSSEKRNATVRDLEFAADTCGMTVGTLLATFWDMGSECRANEGDGALESVEDVISEFSDLVDSECREVGISDRAAYAMALNAFCIGYLTK